MKKVKIPKTLNSIAKEIILLNRYQWVHLADGSYVYNDNNIIIKLKKKLNKN